MAPPVRLAHPTWRRPAGRAGERPAPALAPPLPGRAASAKSRNPRCCCRFRAITSQVARARRVQAATHLLPTTVATVSQERALLCSAVGFTVSLLSSRSGVPASQPAVRFHAPRLTRASGGLVLRVPLPVSQTRARRSTSLRVRPGTHPAGSFLSKGPVAPCRRPHEEGGARQAVRELRLPEPWFRV